MEKENLQISPRSQDFSKWYLDLIRVAKLADNSPVRGTMVIRPNAYALWENIQKILNQEFRELGVENAYFPLLIPKSFFEKEAEHVEGFAKECAIVTHHKLKQVGSKLEPDSKLEEPLILRPTSETIIYHTFANWINSFRDLPLKINQWANVIRWELRTKPFLRTTEFLWQEGHTAHSTEKEADEFTLKITKLYYNFVRNYLAMPVIMGTKSEQEKFAGAKYTNTIEGMMQDGKALQLATSHMLAQNFSKAFEVKYTDENNKEQFVWQTSWGITTRLIGGLIMTHGDDRGLILPPKIAPYKLVIIPIWNKAEEKEKILNKIKDLAENLKNKFNLKLDDRDTRPGPKFYEWESQGIPLRLEFGPKDLENNSLLAVRRDTSEKIVLKIDNELDNNISKLLESIQNNLLTTAQERFNKLSFEANEYSELEHYLKQKQNGFVEALWCGGSTCEDKVKEDLGATIRCLKMDNQEVGDCVVCSKKANKKAIFAKSY